MYSLWVNILENRMDPIFPSTPSPAIVSKEKKKNSRYPMSNEKGMSENFRQITLPLVFHQLSQ